MVGTKEAYDKAKAVIKEDTCIKYHNKTGPLHLETDLSGVRLGAELLQVRDGMNCPQDGTPHSSTLRLTAFTIKGLSSTKMLQQHLKRSICHTAWP